MNRNNAFYIPHSKTAQMTRDYIEPTLKDTRSEGVSFVNDEQGYGDPNAFFNNYKLSNMIDTNESTTILRQQSAIQQVRQKIDDDTHQEQNKISQQQTTMIGYFYLNMFLRIIQKTFMYIFVIAEATVFKPLIYIYSMLPDITSWTWEDKTSLSLAVMIIIVVILYIVQ